MGFVEEVLDLLGGRASSYRSHIDIVVFLAARSFKTGRKKSGLKREVSNITLDKLELPVPDLLAFSTHLVRSIS